MRNFCVLLVLTILLSSCSGSQPSSHVKKVKDGELILILKDNELGAFVLTNRTSEPETAEYSWALYELPETGSELRFLDAGDGIAGKDKIWILPLYNIDSISFGPFSIRWSINTTGVGWVYFDSHPGRRPSSYCVSRYSKLEDVDLAMGNYLFKWVVN